MAEPQTTVTSVTVGTTPTVLVAADDGMQWREVELWPGSASTCFYGDDDVTVNTGIPITASLGRGTPVTVGRNGLWAITATGTATVTVRTRFLDNN